MRHHLLPLLLLPLLLSGPAPCLADPPQQFGYLAPGSPEVGGVRHLCLIYHGQKSRVQWTKDALLPYVAYVDEQGKPIDWLFDSFLFIEYVNDRGTYLHHYLKSKPQPTAADWQWLADGWFRPTTGLAGMEQATAEAGKTLGDPDHKVNVVIALPIPLTPLQEFGPLTGQDKKLDFTNQQDRQEALAWYVDRVAARYRQGSYPHLRLLGFYWTAESIPEAEHAIVQWTAQFLHAKGYKFYWIPYFGAQGLFGWRERGFDAVMLQPNYFFHPRVTLSRFRAASRRAQLAGSGIEMEFDGRALSKDEFLPRLYDYLDAGATYGWMNQAILGWFEGGGALKQLVETPKKGREAYEAIYRFVKGTYTPSGRQHLPELLFVEHDNRDNLALASKGAKITGCIRPEDNPALAPEKILDGQVYAYAGLSGFGYFAIPGSFTVELSEPATVARTQTLLWDLDSRYFHYKIDTSPDGRQWEPAVDKSQGEWSSWQIDKFTPRKARYVRFTGLYNSARQSIFQVVEFEVYSR